MNIEFYGILAIIAAATIHTTTAKYLNQKPSFLAPCQLQDPNFNKCFSSNLQAIFREWKDGVPGLKSFGSLDPIPVKRILIQQDPKNPIALNADLTNVIVRGSSHSIIRDSSVNLKNLVIKTKLFIPKLVFNADYKANGRILNLQLNGHGKAVFEADNILLNIVIHVNLRDQHGFTFTDIASLKMGIAEIGGFHVRLDNLFNGQKALEDSANALINENWRSIYELLSPAITQTIEKILGDRLSKIFRYVPANYLIANIPSAALYYG